MKKTIALLLIAIVSKTHAQEIDKSYDAYDFVAGEKILFEDVISSDYNSTLPANWNIEGGIASVVSEGKLKCVSIDEYYTKLTPKLSKGIALRDTFTIEYETWLDAGYDGNPGVEIHLVNGDNEVLITPNKHVLSVRYPEDGSAQKDNPEAYFGESKFYNRWVHISIAFINKHLTIYLDENKMIDIGDCRLKPNKIIVTGNTAQHMKILLMNFKLATGIPQKMNLINGKFVTHAIKFDVNKATLKPESMSILKQVTEFMKANAAVKFEIGGHTDSDGDAAYNIELSQHRADAVKSQLVSMGVDASRLTTKGYGEDKPISPNTTIEGKADNRRVEFVKM